MMKYMKHQFLSILIYLFINHSLIGSHLEPYGIPQRQPTQDEQEQMFFQTLPEELKNFKERCTTKTSLYECRVQAATLTNDLIRFKNSPHKLPGMVIETDDAHKKTVIRQVDKKGKPIAHFALHLIQNQESSTENNSQLIVATQQEGHFAWPKDSSRPVNNFFNNEMYEHIAAINNICARVAPPHAHSLEMEKQCKTRAVDLAQKVILFSPYLPVDLCNRPADILIEHLAVAGSLYLYTETRDHQNPVLHVSRTPHSFVWSSYNSQNNHKTYVQVFRNKDHTHVSSHQYPGKIHDYSYTSDDAAIASLIHKPKPTFTENPFAWALDNPQKTFAGTFAAVMSAILLKKAPRIFRLRS